LQKSRTMWRASLTWQLGSLACAAASHVEGIEDLSAADNIDDIRLFTDAPADIDTLDTEEEEHKMAQQQMLDLIMGLPDGSSIVQSLSQANVTKVVGESGGPAFDRMKELIVKTLLKNAWAYKVLMRSQSKVTIDYLLRYTKMGRSLAWAGEQITDARANLMEVKSERRGYNSLRWRTRRSLSVKTRGYNRERRRLKVNNRIARRNLRAFHIAVGKAGCGSFLQCSDGLIRIGDEDLQDALLQLTDNHRQEFLDAASDAFNQTVEMDTDDDEEMSGEDSDDSLDAEAFEDEREEMEDADDEDNEEMMDTEQEALVTEENLMTDAETDAETEDTTDEGDSAPEAPLDAEEQEQFANEVNGLHDDPVFLQVAEDAEDEDLDENILDVEDEDADMDRPDPTVKFLGDADELEPVDTLSAAIEGATDAEDEYPIGAVVLPDDGSADEKEAVDPEDIEKLSDDELNEEEKELEKETDANEKEVDTTDSKLVLAAQKGIPGLRSMLKGKSKSRQEAPRKRRKKSRKGKKGRYARRSRKWYRRRNARGRRWSRRQLRRVRKIRKQLRARIARMGCSMQGKNDCDKFRRLFRGLKFKLTRRAQQTSSAIVRLDRWFRRRRGQFARYLGSLVSNIRSCQSQISVFRNILRENRHLRRKAARFMKRYKAQFNQRTRRFNTVAIRKVKVMCALKKARSDAAKVAGIKEKIRDCKMSKWKAGTGRGKQPTKKSACSRKCNTGERYYFRYAKKPALNGGTPCPGVNKMVTLCNLQACPIHCALGRWSPYNRCSSKCGGGVRKRTRKIRRRPRYGGASCKRTLQVSKCNTGPCGKFRCWRSYRFGSLMRQRRARWVIFRKGRNVGFMKSFLLRDKWCKGFTCIQSVQGCIATNGSNKRGGKVVHASKLLRKNRWVRLQCPVGYYLSGMNHATRVRNLEGMRAIYCNRPERQTSWENLRSYRLPWNKLGAKFQCPRNQYIAGFIFRNRMNKKLRHRFRKSMAVRRMNRLNLWRFYAVTCAGMGGTQR